MHRTMAAAVIASCAVALTDAETTELEQMSSEMRFVLDEFEINSKIQLLILRRGYRTLQTFNAMADDRANFRTIVQQDIMNPNEPGLAAAVATEVRLTNSKLLAAWILSGQRAAEEVRATADSRALRLPSMLPRPALIALRSRYENEHGRVSDRLYPCAAMIEQLLEEIEEGSCVPWQLSAVIAADKAVDETSTIQELGATFKVRKTPKAIAMPATTEELRDRFITLAIAHVLASYKFATRLWIKTSNHAAWKKYVEYLLSEDVAKYNLDQENVQIGVTWQTVLVYDYQMRRQLCRRVQYEHKDFATALEEVMKCVEIKEKYFTTPTALLTAARGRPAALMAAGSAAFTLTQPGIFLPKTGAPSPPGQGKKAKRKLAVMQKEAAKAAAQVPPPPGAIAPRPQKAKGKGKGKKIDKTPDGRLVCTFYNREQGCKRSPCTFLHVCNVCMGAHPAFQNAACAGA